jgi:hypothetical protein
LSDISPLDFRAALVRLLRICLKPLLFGAAFINQMPLSPLPVAAMTVTIR